MASPNRSEPELATVEPPPPWEVTYHSLRDVDPDALGATASVWGWFTQDLLQLRHPAGWLIDVGWYPEGAPTGQFRLVVVRDGDWARPERSRETRSLGVLTTELQAATSQLSARSPARPDSDVRWAEWVGWTRDVDGLVALLDHADPALRREVVERLGKLRDPSGRPRSAPPVHPPRP